MKINSVQNNYNMSSPVFKASLLNTTGELNNSVKMEQNKNCSNTNDSFKSNAKKLYKLIIPIFFAALTFAVRYFRKETNKNIHYDKINQGVDNVGKKAMKSLNAIARKPLRVNLNS